VKILLAGDWHGNREWAARCFEVAAARHVDTVLQLGDFGLWPGREDAWLDHVDEQARAAGTTLVWIDGNHENHDALERWRADADDHGLVQMRERVRWASRGARWRWAGRDFGALGGAVSIDRFLRKPGINWWPQEATTQADVDRLGDQPLDVLVTHAAPTTTALTYRRLPLPDGIIADARQVKELLDQAVRRTGPQLVVHGHYHLRLHAQMEERTVEGLAHDKSTPEAALALLDLKEGLVLRTP
jgi:Calcineurin-like phosphoesterase